MMLKWMTSVMPVRIGAAVAAAPARCRRNPAVGGLELQLHVAGKALGLGPVAAAAIDRAQADVGEVAHEDVGEIDRGRRRRASC